MEYSSGRAWKVSPTRKRYFRRGTGIKLGISHENAIFGAPKQRISRFTSQILSYISGSQIIRVLDIGCGTGCQLFDLAKFLPHAHLTGVDISQANISIAGLAQRQLPFDSSINFLAGDYLELELPPFDLIISYSTLHLIPCLSEALFKKISGDLVDGGMLINVMPYDCPYNRCLAFVRRLFKSLRSTTCDKLILSLGKILHKGEYDEEILRERIIYMYQTPYRYDCPELRRFLQRTCCLEIVDCREEVHASVAQLKHKLTVYRKTRTSR